MDYHVIQAKTQSQICQAYELINRVYAKTYRDAFDKPIFDELRSEIDMDMKCRLYICLQSDDQMIGAFCLKPISENVVLLSRFVRDVHMISTIGIGKYLLCKAEEIAKACMNVSKVRIYVLSEKQSLVVYYKSHGYIEVKEDPFERHGDMWTIMEKQLSCISYKNI
jgi:hypothetical protein